MAQKKALEQARAQSQAQALIDQAQAAQAHAQAQAQAQAGSRRYCLPCDPTHVEPYFIDLNSLSAFLETLISSKPRVYLLNDRDQVGQSANRTVGFSKWTVLIGRTGFDTISSIPDPTLNLNGIL